MCELYEGFFHGGSRMTDTTSEPTYSLSACVGTLSLDDHQAPVAFDLHVEGDGRVQLLLRPIALTEGTSWLLKAVFPEDLALPRLRLTATGPGVERLSSEHVYITSTGTASVDGETTLNLTAQAEPMRIAFADSPDPHTRRVAWYRTIGMRGFRVSSREAPEGRVALGAPNTPSDYGALDGIITVDTAKTAAPVGAWLESCDKLIARILDIVSLGQGRFIRYSIRECYVNQTLALLDFYGAKPSTDPYQPVFHHLHLQPVLDLAVQRYTPEIQDDQGVGIAIEWLLMNPTYTEGKFLTVFAALEHLRDVNRKAVRPTLIDDEHFRRVILRRLEYAFDEAATELPGQDLIVLRNKLATLNFRPSTKQLQELLQLYGVPTNDIADRVTRALHIRNRLIHRGKYDGDEPLYQHLTVLRELVVRFILTLLGFKGHYQSYLRNPNWGPFPPEAAPPRSKAVGVGQPES